MSRVFWDSSLFIYLLEECGDFSKRVTAISRRMIERNDQLFTSHMTLGEVLVKPFERGDMHLAERFEDVITRRTALLPFGLDAARRFARIRQDRAIKPPDAIQLACAAAEGMDLFITNDDRLSAKSIPDITFVLSMDRALLLLGG